MKNTSRIATFSLSILLGLALQSLDASAYFRRYHGTECRPVNSASSTLYVDSTGFTNNTSTANVFICPFISDSSQPHNLVTALNVHGQKAAAPGVDSVTTCVKSWAANSFLCSNDIGTSGIGVWGLAALRTAWFNTGPDFSYVKVTLQPQSSLFGIFAAN